VTASSNLYAKCLRLIHFLEKKLYLSENVVKRAFSLLDVATKDDAVRLRIMGKRPSSVVAALIYIASKLEGERTPQWEIAKALNITQLTVRKNYHKIAHYMGMDYLIEKGGLTWLKR